MEMVVAAALVGICIAGACGYYLGYVCGHSNACELHRKAQDMKDASTIEQINRLEEECAGLRSRIDFMRTRVARAVSELTEG